MRLFERTLREVRIAPRAVTKDALGAGLEGFSAQTVKARASVIPSGGDIFRTEAGLGRSGTMALLLPLDASIAPGDGICIDGDTPEWRCVDVRKWSAHQAVQAVRITG